MGEQPDPWSWVEDAYRPPIAASDYYRRSGRAPDPWQAQVLDSEAPKIAILGSRQIGKTDVIGALAMYTAEHIPGSLTVIGAPSQNQAAELLLKAKDLYVAGGRIVEDTYAVKRGGDLTMSERNKTAQDSVLRFQLKNRSRIICVPGKNGTVRGYSGVRLLVIDEAAYVLDDFYQAVEPMLAVSRGRMVLMTTAYARQGAFYKIWTEAPDYDTTKPASEQPNAWLKIMVPWWDCPRIAKSTVDAYRDKYGEWATLREFCTTFTDSVFSAFTTEEIAGMARSEVEWWDDLYE